MKRERVGADDDELDTAVDEEDEKVPEVPRSDPQARRLCRRDPILGEASEGAVEAPSEIQSRLERTDGNHRSSGESSQRIVSSRCGPVEIMQNGTPVSSSRRSR